jgi:hypothetical protein
MKFEPWFTMVGNMSTKKSMFFSYESCETQWWSTWYWQENFWMWTWWDNFQSMKPQGKCRKNNDFWKFQYDLKKKELGLGSLQIVIKNPK